MTLVSIFARHRTAANLLLILFVAFGLFAMSQVRTQLLPDVVVEEIEVDIRWPGAPAEEIDQSVVQVVTAPLLGVPGVAEMRATARDGSARLSMTFEPEWDMDRALRDVDAALPATTSLPDGVDAPVVRLDEWRERVLDVVLYADLDRGQLERVGSELMTALQRAGVTRVHMRGRTTPHLTLIVDPDALALHGLELSDVSEAIRQASAGRVAGALSGDAARLRFDLDVTDTAALRALPLSTDRGLVRLGDITQIQRSVAGSGRAYFANDLPAISLRIDRNATGDTLDIAAQTKRITSEVLAAQSDPIAAQFLRDRAAQIEDRIWLLVDNAALGLLLVLILLYLFLSPSAALWVAAGIPVALAAGLGLMWAIGQTINVISLYALVICVGILVDDAIVVAEHTEHRHRRLGEPRARAAERAARRMLPAVLASTVTTLIAFAALTLIDGRFGRFVDAIPFVVTVVLVASLIECFLILPNHLSHGFTRLDQGWIAAPSRWVNFGFARIRDRVFVPCLRGLIALRYAVLLGVIAATLQAVVMVMDREVSWRFFVSPESPVVTANFALKDQATRADTRAFLSTLEATLDDLRASYAQEHGRDPVHFAVGQIGGTSGRGLAIQDDKSADLLGALTIELIDQDLRRMTAADFARALQEAVPRPELLEAFSFRGGRRGPAGDSLDIVLEGPDLDVLGRAAASLEAELGTWPEITALENSLTSARIDQSLSLNAFGRALGFTDDDVTQAVQERLSGITPLSFVTGGQDADLTLIYPPGTLQADYLDAMRLTTPEGRVVVLGEIVNRASAPAPASLRRNGGQLQIRVTGQIASAEPNAAQSFDDALRTDILPQIEARYGITTRLSGLAAQERAFLQQAQLGYAASLLGIYMALALVLGRWGLPLTIMAVVPAGAIGVVWGHYWMDTPLALFSIVGFIGLSGIIMNDSIVLATAIEEERKTRATVPAVISATAGRLRPVLLTTLTTVLGLTPLLWEGSRQAAFLQPMITTLVFGLACGFGLVLLVVPALVVVLNDATQTLRTLRRSPRLLVRWRRRRGASTLPKTHPS